MFPRPFHRRILYVLALVCAVTVGLICRLAQLQVAQYQEYLRKARRGQIGSVPVLPKRGNVYDRNRRELAASSLAPTLYCNTAKVTTDSVKMQIATELAQVLETDAGALYRRLNYPGHPPLVRAMDPTLARQVDELVAKPIAPAQALYYQFESKRHHPKGDLACHLLGFTRPDDTGDNRGQAGLEQQYDEEIRGNFKKFKIYCDALQKRLTPVDKEFFRSTFGHDLILTIDESIQFVAEEALSRAVAQYRADCGVVIVQKCRTGEILAMASVPKFDPDRYSRAQASHRRNRSIEYAFNMGSIMKVFTAAALIETGTLRSVDELINCHNGTGWFPPRRVPVRDAPGHTLGIVPFRQAFMFSSNCGMVEACKNLNPADFHRILSHFGFGAATGIDLPAESPGILHPLSEWNDYSMLALPYGGEIAATPIQLANAVSAVANNGRLMRPYVVAEVRTYEGALVRRTEPTVVRRVISPTVAQKVLELMEDVVGHPTPEGKWEGGTGTEARIRNYRVGGKTGTYKYITRDDSRTSSYTASFVAVLPLPSPELTVLCCIDQPKGAKYGGAVAAPVVREVSEGALRILGIPPNRTDRTAPDIETKIQSIRDRSRPVRARTPRDIMPNLIGMTMREAARHLERFDLDVMFEGSGVVVVQDPEPLASLGNRRSCTLYFGSPEGALAE